MPVDTRNKRSSCLGIAGPYRFVLPNPDGSVSQEDRQHVVYSYPGIEASVLEEFSAPYYATAAQVFQAGARAAQVFQAGARAAQVQEH